MRRLLTAITLLVILLASSWPLLHSGFFRVHDFTHGARIAEMTRAIVDGHIPPQWSENFGYGYGMPLFLFYAPLPYYFGALVYWLSGSLLFAVSSLFWLANIATLTGSYYLGKRLFGSLSGVLMAALITLAPYRAVNLFVRGATSETWGIAASIWMLLGLVLVIKKQKYAWLILCLSTVGLLLSHNLITLIFLPFFSVFALVLLVFGKAWKQTLTVFGSGLLGLGISAFYILPAFLEKSFTQVEERILSKYFDFHLHFLYLRQLVTAYWGYGGSVWGPNDGISFFLGFGMLIGLIVAIFVFIKFLYHKQANTKFLVFFSLSMVLSVVAFLATTAKTITIWENLPLLRFVQFPWRFLSVGIIFLSMVIVSAVSVIKNKFLQFVITITLLILLLGNGRYFQPESYLDNPESLYSADKQQIRENMSGVLPDYLPQGFVETSLPPNLDKVIESPQIAANKVLLNRVQEKLILTDFDNNRELIFALADFPGWQVEIDGKRTTHRSTQKGLISVAVPSGLHQVGVRFLPTPTRLVANIISFSSLLLLLILLLYQEKKS